MFRTAFALCTLVICNVSTILYASEDPARLKPVAIDGVARFEPRTTQVILPICEHEPCPKPQKYWSLVVRSGKHDYELAQKFEENSDRAPMTIQLEGVAVHSGAEIALEAKAFEVSKNFSYIYEPKNVVAKEELGGELEVSPGDAGVAPDADDEWQAMNPWLDESRNSEVQEITGWLCRSIPAQGDQNEPLKVALYRTRIPSPEGFVNKTAMRITTRQAGSLEFVPVRMEKIKQLTVFNGRKEDRVQAELSIFEMPGRWQNVPATLNLVVKTTFETGFTAPIESAFDLSCEKRRVSR